MPQSAAGFKMVFSLELNPTNKEQHHKKQKNSRSGLFWLVFVVFLFIFFLHNIISPNDWLPGYLAYLITSKTIMAQIA